MNVIIDVFHQYSRREGDKDTLTKKELKLLIEKQLANYLKVPEGAQGWVLHTGRELGWIPGLGSTTKGLVSSPKVQFSLRDLGSAPGFG